MAQWGLLNELIVIFKIQGKFYFTPKNQKTVLETALFSSLFLPL